MKPLDSTLKFPVVQMHQIKSVSYTHLRAHETVLDLVCRLLLEKKKKNTKKQNICDQKDKTQKIKYTNHTDTNRVVTTKEHDYR